MVYLIDFEDSFTWNIVAELEKFKIKVIVIPHNEVDFRSSSLMSKLLSECLFLGPGPGHPNEYQDWIGLIRQKVINRSPTLGICLGHQIMALAQGAKLFQLPTPKHGLSSSLELPDWEIFTELKSTKMMSVEVQWYNSWAVASESREKFSPGLKLWEWETQIVGIESDYLLSFQFHPESVGSSYPEVFFSAFQKKIYNVLNAKKAN